MSKDLKIGAAVAVLLHGLLFFGFAHRVPAEYPVTVSPSSLEVSLVAAPKVVEISPEVKEETRTLSKQVESYRTASGGEGLGKSISNPSPSDAVRSIRSIKKEPKPSVKQTMPAQPVRPANRIRGAFTEAKPLETRNEPPRYPRVARVKGHEGTVLLLVEVDSQGKPSKVSLKKSSGFKSLDRSALKAIKAWQFVPAKRFGVPTQSQIQIPVVFRLELV